MKSKALLTVAALLLGVLPVTAALSDVRRDKLPPNSAIEKAYSDVLAVEPMVHQWTEQWPYSTPRQNVSSALQRAMTEIGKVTASVFDNEELWLLSGLVASYSYNVDVDGSYDIASKSFDAARKLDPSDFRIEWFQGALECQTTNTRSGMGRLLLIEDQHPWQKLPVSFWDDYLACSTITVMPAHTLRAADHLSHLAASHSDYRDGIVEIARKRFVTPAGSAPYSKEQVWWINKDGKGTELTNTMFGLRFFAPVDWTLSLSGVENAQTLAQIKIGPYQTPAGDVSPNILVIVRPAKQGESLEDFLKNFEHYASGFEAAAPTCPTDSCLAAHAMVSGAYKAAGDGHFTLTVFKRDQPEFPGTMFEEPLGLPNAPTEQPTYFRPTQRIHRLQGTLYYLVALDTASSVQEQANGAYKDFLKKLQIE